MEQILIYLYFFAGVVANLFYIPQILKYVRCNDSRKSISMITWVGWTINACIALLYAHIVIKDVTFQVVTTMNFMGCLTILCFGLSAKKEIKVSLHSDK